MFLNKAKKSGLAYNLDLKPWNKRMSAFLLSIICDTEIIPSMSLYTVAYLTLINAPIEKPNKNFFEAEGYFLDI